jgi:hypothetical protein
VWVRAGQHASCQYSWSRLGSLWNQWKPQPQIELLKTFMKNRSDEENVRYKIYRSLFNKVVRAIGRRSSTMHSTWTKIKQKPFELWQLLKEVSTGSKETSKIKKNWKWWETNHGSMWDSKSVSQVGQQISDSVLPVEKDSLDYIPDNPN